MRVRARLLFLSLVSVLALAAPLVAYAGGGSPGPVDERFQAGQAS